DEPVVDHLAEEVVDAMVVGEPAVDEIAAVAEGPRTRRGRRIGRRRVPEPDVVLAAAAVDDSVGDAAVEEQVLEEPVVDDAVGEEIVDESAAEPVVDVAVVESLFTPPAEEPRVRRARRFGKRHAPAPEVAAAVDEPVVDS